MYASFLGISRALHLDVFEQPASGEGAAALQVRFVTLNGVKDPDP